MQLSKIKIYVISVLVAVAGCSWWYSDDAQNNTLVNPDSVASKDRALVVYNGKWVTLEEQKKLVSRDKNHSQKLELIKRLDIKMIYIPDGEFLMGSDNGSSYEKPVHTVSMKKFELGQYEVTQKQWREIMDDNPSYFKGCDDCPVEKVSWDDVSAFIKKLNQLTGMLYRLPTEAEWEYACRSRSENKAFCGGSSEAKLAWYFSNSDRKTHPVGQKSPNNLDFYDMTGNVWEWVQDCWNDSYNGAPENGEAWSSGDCGSHVLRGGSWDDKSYDIRLAYRNWADSDKRYLTYGFRLALD